MKQPCHRTGASENSEFGALLASGESLDTEVIYAMSVCRFCGSPDCLLPLASCFLSTSDCDHRGRELAYLPCRRREDKSHLRQQSGGRHSLGNRWCHECGDSDCKGGALSKRHRRQLKDKHDLCSQSEQRIALNH